MELDQLNNWEQEETFYAQASSKPSLARSDEESTLGTSCTQFDSDKSDREARAALSKPAHHNALEVEAMCKISSETFHAQASSEPQTDKPDEESMLGTSCTQLDSEKLDRQVWASSSKPAHDNALEDEAVSKIPRKPFQVQASSPRIDQSGEEPMLGTSHTQLDSENSDREVEVLGSSSKPGYHTTLEVEAVSKISSVS